MNYDKTKSISIVVLGLFVAGCSGATCAGLVGCTGDTFSSPDSGSDAGDGETLDAAGDVVSVSDGGMEAAPDALAPEGGSDADAAPADKRVFITSSRTTSDFGSLAAADAICQTAASGASLGGTWKAWLSTATVSAGSRLTHSTTAYRLVDGTLVAQDWAHLVSGVPLKSPIDLDENGVYVPGPNGQDGTSGYIWSGTSASGNSEQWNCSNWTVSEDCSQSTSVTASIGSDQYATSPAWSSNGSGPACCTVQKLAFYCFEQ
jgi:hypothetical protein